jgi:hypothetical protein
VSWIIFSLLFIHVAILYFEELTGGDGEKKDAGNDEEDPEVK